MNALEYAQALVAFESTSQLSNVPIIDYLEDTLQRLGFSVERIEYVDAQRVTKANLVGQLGDGVGGMAYFGHTDVVPADSWSRAEHGPFEPLVEEGKLWGRGCCDMKGSVACILAAAETVLASDLKHPLYITCTADEEIGYVGAAEVAKRSRLYQQMIQGKSQGIVGEPTRLEIVHAHKGTFGFRVVSKGKAGHSSGTDGVNANLAMIPFLSEMKRIHDETLQHPAWLDEEFDPPDIRWNIGVNDHTRAVNMTAAQSVCTVYFRPMPGQEGDILIGQAREAADQCGLDFEILWRGQPVYMDPNSAFVRKTLELAGRERSRTVSYGTDACMFQAMNYLVILGPGDIAQAHTDDEWIALDQLDKGTQLYSKLIRHWCL